MQGQFIYGTLRGANLRVTAILRNTVRDASDIEQAHTMFVGLSIFSKGELIHQDDHFCIIEENQFVTVDERDLPLLGYSEDEYLILFQCKRGEGDSYFPQEHQLNYEVINADSKECTVIYDQLPIISVGSVNPRPILLLAPKLWMSKYINTFVSFTNTSPKRTEEGVSWEMMILDTNGVVIKKAHIKSADSDAFTLNLREFLKDCYEFSDDLKMFTFLARANTVSSTLLTFIKNEISGNISVEHSLSPHYYINGDFSRVRDEAFKINSESPIQND